MIILVQLVLYCLLFTAMVCYPMFTFLEKGREGEQEIIDDINRFWEDVQP